MIIFFDGKETEFKTSGATAILYKRCFHEDLILEVVNFKNSTAKLKEAEKQNEEDQNAEQIAAGLVFLEIVQKLAYIMWLEANVKDIFNRINFENYIAWLMKLSPDAFNDKEINMQIFNLWNSSTQGTSKPKN